MTTAAKIQSLKSSAFLRFLVTGGIAAGANILSRVVLSFLMPFSVAVLFAFFIGMTTAYILARLFVFARSGQSIGNEYGRFVLVNLVALAQVWLISVGLAEWLFPATGMSWHPELIAHTIGVISPVFTSYYGHKFFTFRQQG